MRNLPIILVTSGIAILSLTQCARVVSPTGGPKDTLAPVVLRSLPEQFSRNVTEKKLEIAFNEYVTLKDLQKQLFVSPPLEELPEVKERGRKLEILFKKPLAANTTYSLNFVNSIVDVNENNPLRNYSYIFSTGSRLDTMRINGTVYDARTMLPVEDAYVFMYENDSLETPLKHKPDVIAKTDKKGIFIANNMKHKDYKVIAIKDANRNLLFDPSFDQIAFEKKLFGPVNISARPDTLKDSIWRAQLPPQIKLKLFSEGKQQQFIKGKARSEKFAFSIYFNSPYPEIKKIDFGDVLTMDDLLVERDSDHDTITYWLKDATRRIPDTLIANYTYMKSDSTGKLVETVEKVSWELPLAKQNRQTAKEKKREEKNLKEQKIRIPKFNPNFEAPDGSVNSDGGLLMKFSTPLIALDTAKFKLIHIDDNDRRETVPVTIKPLGNSLTTFEVKAKWIEDSHYEMLADSNIVKSIQHYYNDSVKYKFTTSNSGKFGTFNITFKKVKEQLIVQILDSRYKLVRQKLIHADGVLKFPYIKADSYYIRIIEDRNKNEKWDTGNYLQQLEPERVMYLHKEKEKKFQLRTGWENEINVDIEELFSTY